ncbi:MAG: multiheme c-type cytochrome [Acidobacteriota bacterium]
MKDFRLELLLTAGLVLALGATGALASMEVTHSDRCGECHRDIYRMWRDSSHALALEDPIFLDAYRDAQRRGGEGVSRTCLGCHAPFAAATGDLALKERITWEGVSCDYCHSIVAVDDSQAPVAARIEVGRVKRGPIPDAESPGHEVAYSPLHAGSLVCAPCHEYVNGEGTPIMTTYSEWKSGSAARDGSSCQTCHMGLTRANVVDPRVKRVAGAAVNLHQVPGGHSLEQLHRALSLSMEPRRSGDRLELRIRIVNRGAGHAVPTGMPGRRVILDLLVETSAGKTYREKQVYEKSFLSADGRVILHDSGFFAPGVALQADTRIQVDEHRQEMFTFPLSAGDTAYVTVRLHYEHAPRGPGEEKIWLTFLSERRVVPPA